MLLFILIMLVPYLLVGAKVAKHQYTISWRKYNDALPVWEHKKTFMLQNLKEFCEQNDVSHESYCNVNYQHLRDNGCDCSKGKAAYSNYLRKNPAPSKPGVPYHTLFTWPVVGLSTYITSGTRELPSYEEQMRIDAENALLDKRLAELK
jgi:hypothetical protein